MKNRILQTLSLIACVAIALQPIAWACGGPPLPPDCPRSIFISKFPPCSVVIPPAGSSIHVPIGLIPFVTWKKGRICAQPLSSKVTVSAVCTPAGGGAPVVVPAQMFDLGKPKMPGAQPVKGGLIDFVIPPGLFLPGGPPHKCVVTVVYEVQFDPAKPGSTPATLTSTSTACICLIPPCSYDPELPRLLVKYLPRDPRGREYFQTCRKGDQTEQWFIVTNNDATETVTLDITSEGTQVARLPDGFSDADLQAAYDAGITSPSNPKAGTDVFPAQWLDMLAPGALVPEADPEDVDPRKLTRMVTIPPLESRILCIAVRSYGMCANGSCGERNLVVDGYFGAQMDNDPAIGCAATSLLVSDRKPKSPLCEFSDKIATATSSDSLFTMGIFRFDGTPLPHTASNFSGNVAPELPNGSPNPAFPGTQLTGRRLAPLIDSSFPNMAFDYVRVDSDHPANEFEYDVLSFPLQPGNQFAQEFNSVEILGIDQLAPGKNICMPLVVSDPPGPSNFRTQLDITVDLRGTTPTIAVQGTAFEGMINFTGPLKDFLRRPPPGLGLHKTTFRKITKVRGSDLDSGVISARPVGAMDGSRAITVSGIDSFFDVFYTGTPTPAGWTAKINPLKGAQLLNKKGPFTSQLMVEHRTRGTAANASHNISWIGVSARGAINSPFLFPVNTRVLKDVCMIDDTDPNKQFAFNSEIGDYRGMLPNGAGGFLFFGGRGTARNKGDSFTLSTRSRDLQILAEIVAGTGEGSANITFRGQPPVAITDTSAFATCP